MNALQRAAVAGMLNRAIGRAASALNDLVREEVRLSVAFIDFVTAQEAVGRLSGHGGAESVAVKQRFAGPFYGDLLVIFPERRSLELVRAILEDTVPLDVMTELEQDALVEVCNIILNAVLGCIAEELKVAFQSSLPIYVRGVSHQVLEVVEHGPIANVDDIVMFLHVDFALEHRPIGGWIAFLMDIASARSFRDHVEAYLRTAAVAHGGHSA